MPEDGRKRPYGAIEPAYFLWRETDLAADFPMELIFPAKGAKENAGDMFKNRRFPFRLNKWPQAKPGTSQEKGLALRKKETMPDTLLHICPKRL